MTLTFAELLKAHRLRSGLTQERLAEKSGVSTRTIRGLETGRRREPRLASVHLLAAALSLNEANTDALIAASRGAAPADAGRAAGWPGAARSLPYDVPDFTGREVELARLIGQADRSEAATVVISAIDGMAGVGKTALAVRAAHLLADRYPDGQLFVDLHGFTPGRQPLDPAAALDTLLRMLGVPAEAVPADQEQRAAVWRSELAPRRVVLLLDNAADAAQVRPLLPGASGCLVLVTSRRRMPGLPGAVPLSLDVLPADEAAALFADVCGADGEADAVAEIVALCGRLPLAVRIASARLAHRSNWSPAHLAARLRDENRRLAELAVDGELGVAAAFSLSYTGLDDLRRRVFRLLGCHPGGDFDPLAAATLADLPLAEAERALESLVDCHLLLSSSPDRYTFHDLLRQHARQLAEAEESAAGRQAALGRLFDHQLRTAVAAVRVLAPHERDLPDAVPPGALAVDLSDDAAANAWLARELPNLVAGAVNAAGAGWPDHAPALSLTLWRWLDDRSRHAEALTLHGAALAVARAAGDLSGQAGVLCRMGQSHWRWGRYEPATEHYRRALELAGRAGDQHTESVALSGLGNIAGQSGRYEQATEHYERALVLLRAVGNRVTEASTRNNLGIVHQYLGRYEDALACHRQALTIARETGNRNIESMALTNLGVDQRRLGHYREAVDCHRQALALAREAGDAYGESFALNDLGVANLLLGEHESALVHHRQALAVAREVGNRVAEGGALNGLGRAHLRQGFPAEAEDCHRKALALARETDDWNAEAEALLGLGEATVAAGDPTGAVAHLRQALVMADRIKDRHLQAETHAGLGRAFAACGDDRAADGHRRRAAELYAGLGTPEPVLSKDTERGGE
ncbi:ATP-binding protein [Solihabitans fulvus]|uniref:ATP-binding protein n=1 Tax=Solihabitans fulvus TaxID=1892852 RepID=UPI001661A127|nr:helix-turn-helix domain-containing protein [Solihabitans fulvus]